MKPCHKQAFIEGAAVSALISGLIMWALCNL